MNAANVKPDLLLPSPQSVPVQDAYGVSLALGFWWLLFTSRWLLTLLGETLPGKIIALIMAPFICWLTLLLAMLVCALLSHLLLLLHVKAETKRRDTTSAMFLTACSALAVALACHSSSLDRALGVLWGMGLLICFSRQWMRKIATR